MNNFVFGQDPLLYTSPTQLPMHNDMDIKRQLDTVMAQYQALQQQKPPVQPEQIEDHLGSLDNMVKDLDVVILESLNGDPEFTQINLMIQQAIQSEIVNSIKHKLNTNPEIISKINRAKDIIKEFKTTQENEDRKSLSELNDYITNYSDMTFNEYKQFKLSKQNNK